MSIGFPLNMVPLGSFQGKQVFRLFHCYSGVSFWQFLSSEMTGWEKFKSFPFPAPGLLCMDWVEQSSILLCPTPVKVQRQEFDAVQLQEGGRQLVGMKLSRLFLQHSSAAAGQKHLE